MTVHLIQPRIARVAHLSALSPKFLSDLISYFFRGVGAFLDVIIWLRSFDMRRTSVFDCLAFKFLPDTISRKTPRSLPSITAVRSGFSSKGFVISRSRHDWCIWFGAQYRAKRLC